MMKKFTLFAVAALLAGSAMAQDVSVGIERPTFTTSDGTVIYDTWNYIGSVDKFNRSVDGVTAKFFQTEEIEATIVKDETQEGGYEVKNVCHQGVSNIPVDYCWKLNCTAGSATKHNDENPLGSENWAFGFDLTVAEGMTFTVNAIDFDLLVEQNPAYRIRIMQGETELYNSTWVTKTGSYNNEVWGIGSYCRIDETDVSFFYEKLDADGNAINYQAIQYNPCFDGVDNNPVTLPAGGLVLAAGTYRVMADVDYNKDSAKAMSFDNFTLDGTLEGGSAMLGDVVGIARPTFTNPDDGTVIYDTWNYIESVDKFNKSVDGVTAKFFQTAEIEATIVKDETQEGGYEIKNLCHQGVKNIPVDYCWKLNCTAGSATKHNAENPLGSENWAFGFDLTVAEGKTYTVNAIDFDLLVEQNPAYRIRIIQGETELYNSTWVTKTGSYNNEVWGIGSYCRIDETDVSFFYEKLDADGNAINYQAIQYNPCFDGVDNNPVTLPAGGLVLAAGTYRVMADVDYNKDSAKAMSFDNFTLIGEVGNAAAINDITTEVVKDNKMFNIAGQRISAPVRGQIYIINGKKYIAK